MGRSKSIKISYDIFDSPIWEEKRVFSRFEAYVDMVLTADISSRQMSSSLRLLADRWNWTVGRVRWFISQMCNDGFITVSALKMGMIITINNTLNDTPNDTQKPSKIKGLCAVNNTPNDTPNDTPRKETSPVPLNKETSPTPPIEINPPISPKEKNGTPSYTPPCDFEEWWELYDKKVERAKCEVKWNRLSTEEKMACIAATPVYVASTPDKQYRKNPQTYLNNKSWNDEIINYGTDNNKEQQRRQRLIEAADLFAEYAGAGK